ncbi:type II toxin-antitoxin system HipA family toxin [Dokdonella ginsengisoli]|uniref:Type II toxin-antitoxin system HipA family toxin n=1 Tax=Dokdonella ginsengisoli TaxID=363846 RepID=A0ABV9QYN6_9GAMM
MTAGRNPLAINHLAVATPQGASGTLAQEDGRFLFGYVREASRAAEISLLMPYRIAQYESRELHPIFQMNLPEGYVLERLRNRVAKAAPVDPMLLLALTGREASIGRVRVEAPEDLSKALGLAPGEGRGERLEEILAWEGAGSLFDELAQRYLFRTGISGVQPKLLVPEALPPGKVSLATSDLIVKSGGGDYPGLAVNEFVCMCALRRAGVPVPEFFLSADRELFVMRRFDRAADGAALGFEEMAVLMGKGAAQKYEGSYEQVARVVEMFCAPQRRLAALAQLFDQIALSCILGNGDAHLKNFGVLYTDPTSEDVWAAPAYDVVNTTAYIPQDSLALTLGGSKSFFAARLHLLDFGERCGVAEPRRRIQFLIGAVEEEMAAQRELLAGEPAVGSGIRRAFENFSRGF